MKALIVDDSKAMRLIIRKAIEAKGFTATEAENGLKALDILKSEAPFDVMLADCNMPEMDGLELVRKVRSDAAYTSMRILFVTSQTEAELVNEALEAGADEYLMKPFLRVSLYEKLELLGLIEDSQ